jgi:hypothetical protein
LQRLTELVVAQRERLDVALRLVAVAAPAIAVVTGLVHYAITKEVDGVRFLVLYVAPIFLAAPLWMRHRLRGFEQRSGGVQAIDAAVFALSVLRFVAGEALPFSGHMLFLTYTGITVRASGYRWLVVLLLIETTIFKFVLWDDRRSWGIGLGLGVAAALIATALPRGS